LRIVVAADTWLERKGLLGCLQATGVNVDVSHAENGAQLCQLAHQYALRTVVLAEAAMVMRPLKSGQWESLHDWRRLRWVVACSDADRPELMRLLPQRHAGDVVLCHDARSITVLLSRLITPVRGLPARQQEVLSLIQQGMSNKQIAASMGVANGTVKNHVSALFRKLNLHSRTQAALSRFETDARRSVRVE
jgi:ATP/maltotriose-dependent transcriptional regulator MalT